MSEPVRIELRGRAVPGQRAQSKFRWLPKRQKDALAALKYAATEAMGDRPMFTGAVALSLHEDRPIPKTWSKKKHGAALTAELLPITKPDLKNILWLAEDALTGVVYADDAQVCRHYTSKYYGDQPRLLIVVAEITGPARSGSAHNRRSA